MTKQEMYNIIKQEDKQVQANKIKRSLKFIFGCAIILFIISISWFKVDILVSLLVALLGAGLYFYTGLLLWVPFIQANDRENKHLEEMKKDYQQEFNETWY